jgi:hypothetical protein
MATSVANWLLDALSFKAAAKTSTLRFAGKAFDFKAQDPDSDAEPVAAHLEAPPIARNWIRLPGHSML